MNEKKSYKVQIFEELYVLTSDEAECSVLKAAEIVDTYMKEISNYSAVADPKKIAVLAALRLAEKLLIFESQHNKEREKTLALKDYIDQEISLPSL